MRLSSALLTSLTLHVGLTALGVAGRIPAPPARVDSQRVFIELQPVKPPPPAELTPEPEPEPMPEPLPTKSPRPAPARPPPAEEAPAPAPDTAQPVPTEPPPTEPPPAAPEPASVGLSPDALLEDARGPAFAAGHSLHGATSSSARSLKQIAASRSAVPGTPSTDPGPPRRSGPARTLPRRTRPAQPAYPPLLERQGIEAEVMVKVSLDERGRVTAVSILRPSPHAEFNAAARAAALSEAFEPARRYGQAIPYTLSFTYRFRLEER